DVSNLCQVTTHKEKMTTHASRPSSVVAAMLLAPPTKPRMMITSMHKTFKTCLFFTRKKKQKNLTAATSAKGGFALVARLKKTRDRSYFSKRCAEKSPP